jgi:hypothetical protein
LELAITPSGSDLSLLLPRLISRESVLKSDGVSRGVTLPNRKKGGYLPRSQNSHC